MIKDMIDKQVLELKKLWANKRQLMFQLLNLAMIVFSALMIWKGLMFMTKVRPARHTTLCMGSYPSLSIFKLDAAAPFR
eukprot:scaffold3822_cov42-Attheya_sp.AAC.3